MSQRDLLPFVSSRTGAVLITVAVLVAVAGPGVAVGSVGASDSPDDLSVQAQQERTEVAVSLVPDATVAVDETTTYDVVVEPESADGSIGAYDLTVEVSDSTVASLTEVDLKGAIVPPEPIADDGSSARVAGALGDEDQALTDDEDGAVTVATVTVTADAQGESDLSLSVDTISTASGNPYDVTEVDDGSITVESDSSDNNDVSRGSNSDPGTDSSDSDDGSDSNDGGDADSSDDGADSGDSDESDGESGATTDQGDTSQSDADATSEQEQQQESAADSSETEPEAEAGGFQNPTAVVLVALVSFVAILTAVYYLRRQ